MIEWIAELELQYRFLSAKFLREKMFSGDPAAQEALQFALDHGLLKTYKVENPKNPSWPTTACRLNRSHGMVEKILKAGKPS